MSDDLRTRPVKCRCRCHRFDSIRHCAPCCCRHRYKRNCPQCARDRRAEDDQP